MGKSDTRKQIIKQMRDLDRINFIEDRHTISKKELFKNKMKIIMKIKTLEAILDVEKTKHI